eukprot:1389852-Ditylum_brightwellii.AAC.1
MAKNKISLGEGDKCSMVIHKANKTVQKTYINADERDCSVDADKYAMEDYKSRSINVDKEILVRQTQDTSSSQEHLFSSGEIETKTSLQKLPTKEIDPTVNVAYDILAVYRWTQEQCTSLEDCKRDNSYEDNEEHPKECFSDDDSESELGMLL